MNELLWIWGLGAAVIWVFVFLVLPWGCDPREDLRIQFGKTALILIWPVFALVMAVSMVLDFACFVIAVLRKPH